MKTLKDIFLQRAIKQGYVISERHLKEDQEDVKEWLTQKQEKYHNKMICQKCFIHELLEELQEEKTP